MKSRMLRVVVPILIALVAVFYQRCSAEKFTNEAGRSARLELNPKEEAALGLQSYREVLATSSLIRSGSDYEFVRRVAERLAAATGEPGKDFQWEVSLVQSPQVNAFCLPGGKIVVYTGILPVARTESGLAVVMGHEMAHATLRHGSERLLQQKTTNTLLTGVSVATGDLDPQQRRLVLGAFGAGAQYGYLLPFSRDHETEADVIGLHTMARAGFDPREAVAFWERMAAASGGKAPPEFASTHPADTTRIQRLKDEMPKALEIYRAATAGRALEK
jgi:predicted Zn-dependent protease